MTNHLLSLDSLGREGVREILDLSHRFKREPGQHRGALAGGRVGRHRRRVQPYVVAEAQGDASQSVTRIREVVMEEEGEEEQGEAEQPWQRVQGETTAATVAGRSS